VRIRTTSSTALTKIFPSPILPVLAAVRMMSHTDAASPPSTKTSTLIFGRKSTMYSAPRKISVWPLPAESFDLHHRHSLDVGIEEPSFTSSSLNGLMIASIFFTMRVD
jgi:hypothetical protein